MKTAHKEHKVTVHHKLREKVRAELREALAKEKKGKRQ